MPTVKSYQDMLDGEMRVVFYRESCVGFDVPIIPVIPVLPIKNNGVKNANPLFKDSITY